MLVVAAMTSRLSRIPYLEFAILVVAAFVALELKRPFGLLAHQVLGPPGAASAGSPFALSPLEYLQLVAVLVGCLVNGKTGLPVAPWLERVLYGWHADKKLVIWRSALVGVFITLVYTALYAVVVHHLGLTSKLGTQLHGPTLPRSVVLKLAALYPLAAIGAAISEELVYRFAIISIAVAIVFFLLPRTRTRPWAIFWPIIVLGGLFFGYVHVVENLETVQTGSLALDVLTTPQSWAGVIFGYVFCRYGLEAAMITHALSDLMAPFMLRLLQAA
jgi:hypothetical protein